MFYTIVSRFSWIKLARCSHSVANSHYSDLVFIDKHRVINFLNSNKRGLIIATIHMGDYLSALYVLSQGISVNKQVYIVRNKTWSQEEEKIFNRFKSKYVSVNIIRHDPSSARKVIQALRRGNIVILLFDLSDFWGGTTTVQFLGHPMKMVRGPAELALLGRADILPIMCHFDDLATPFAQAFPVIQPATESNQNPTDIIQHVTQKMINIADQHIRKHPEQWHHWPLVPQMLLKSD